MSAGLVAAGVVPDRGADRELRPGALPDAGNGRRRLAPPARAGRKTRQRATGLVRSQRPGRALGHLLRQRARAGRGLRRTGPLVLPHGGLPHVRDGSAGRLAPVPSRAAGAPRGWQPADLLLAAGRRGPCRRSVRAMTRRVPPSMTSTRSAAAAAGSWVAISTAAPESGGVVRQAQDLSRAPACGPVEWPDECRERSSGGVAPQPGKTA